MSCKASSIVFSSWDDSDEDACVVDYCMNIMDVARKESCGKCVLCREGTNQIYEIIKDITEGKVEREDFELLLDVLAQIKDNASCEMASTAASICMDLMKTHEEEWDLHIRRKKCKALVCKGTYTLYVDPEICNGCGKCLDSCPQGAIVGANEMIHLINTDICKKCLVCVSVCPKGAIKKAGSMKPKIPSELVPVGSFNQSLSDEESGTTRRRRRGT